MHRDTWTIKLWPLIPRGVFTFDLGSAPTERRFKFTRPCYGFIQHVFLPPCSCSVRILQFMHARFVSRWDPDILNPCTRAKGRLINRTVDDLNGHPRKIINTKITVRMDTTRRKTETRDTETKTDSACFRYRGEDVSNRSRFRVLRRRRLRRLWVDSTPIEVQNIDNC